MATEQRIFKRRILILDTMVCKESGGRTFIEGYLQILNDMDIAVDYMTYGGTDECVRYFKNKYDNINEFIALNKEIPDLQKYRADYENKKAFYGVYFHNPFTDAMVISKVHEMLNTYIYDNVFINHVDNYPAFCTYFPISNMINTFTYTHCCQTFTDTPAFHMGMYEQLNTDFLRTILAKDNAIDIVSQKNSRFVHKHFPDNKKDIIGMPLDVDKFHKFFNPTEAEDSVLFLGRFNQKAKNMQGWVDTMAKTNLKGIIIVPSKKNADSFKKLLDASDFDNYELHYDLTFEEKMRISSKCKVCFIPSYTENFPFVAYENLNIMRVIALERVWSTEFNEILPDLEIVSEEDAPEVLMEAVKNYKAEDIVNQYKNLVTYNGDIGEKWIEYFKKEPKYVEDKSKETQIIKGLKDFNTLPLALKGLGKEALEFSELTTLYRNLDWSEVIQTKEASFYNKVALNEQEEFYDEW
jgi:hypothetical protein